MNFAVYIDNIAEIHGYFVPDGYSKRPRINVRLNGEWDSIEIYCWIFVEGARSQGLHETGEVGFILSEDNIKGISSAKEVEIFDAESGLVIYRRAQPGQYIHKKILRIETSYVPHTELDVGLKPHFQFYEHKIERYGFETIRQMIEILHQPSVYISGRVLIKNFLVYIDYNIDDLFINVRDPFYEMAMRIMVFSRHRENKFSFVGPRDQVLYSPVIDWFHDLDLTDESSVINSIKTAPKDTVQLLASPFTQQLVASTPSDLPELDHVSIALDRLSQFTIFNSGSDEMLYPRQIEDFLNLSDGTLRMNGQIEPIHNLANILRKIDRVEHILEADLLLYHFVQKAEQKVESQQ